MECKEFKKILYSIPIDELDKEKKEEFFTHSNLCPECKIELETVKKMIKTFEIVTVPGEIPEPTYYFGKPKRKERKYTYTLMNPKKIRKSSLLIAAVAVFLIVVMGKITNFFLPEKESDFAEVNSALYEIAEIENIGDNIYLEEQYYKAESLYISEEDIYFLLSTLSDDELEEFNNILINEYGEKLSLLD